MKFIRTLLFLFCISLFLSSCLVVQRMPNGNSGKYKGWGNGNNGKHKGWENGNGNNGNNGNGNGNGKGKKK